MLVRCDVTIWTNYRYRRRIFLDSMINSLPDPAYSTVIAKELNLGQHQTQQALRLMDEGNTIPFIARYRKEATQELDENQLRDIEDRYRALQVLHQRKNDVLRLLHEQGVMDDEQVSVSLIAAIKGAKTPTE